MTVLKLNNFSGLVPKADRRNIPHGHAERAEDVRFDAGDLSPIRKSYNRAAPFTGDAEIGNLFFYEDQESEGFVGFGDGMEVSFIRSPTPNDAHRRLYFNVKRPASDPVTAQNRHEQDGFRAIGDPLGLKLPEGASDLMDASFGSGTAYRPFQGYRVGVPAPASAPEATLENEVLRLDYGTISEISPGNPITFTADTALPFANGAVVRITINPTLPKPPESTTEEDGAGELPPGEEETSEPTPEPTEAPYDPTGRMWALDGLAGVVRNVGAFGDNSFEVFGIDGSLIGAEGDLSTNELTLDEKNAVRITREVSDADMESRAYVFTYVTQFGEEGPPSPPSNVLSTPMEGSVVNISVGDVDWIYDEHRGDRRFIDRVRLYRATTGSQRARYLFVGDIPLASLTNTAPELAGEPFNPELAWIASTTDDNDPINLGEPLESELWYPPELMDGVRMMPNGFLVGWKNNVLYFSEPYLPHAWNPDNRRTVSDDIIGVQVVGNMAVIGTRGRPYIADGADPSAIRLRHLDEFAPLAKPRAMVEADGGVIYPSTSGLSLVSSGRTTNITKNLFDKKTWEDYVGLMEKGIFFDGRMIFFSPGQRPIMLDMNGETPALSRLSAKHDYSAACIAGSDLVFVGRNSAGVYNQLMTFKDEDTAPANEIAQWDSGIITLPKPCNMAVGQVYASAYPVFVEVGYPALANGQPNFDSFVYTGATETFTISGITPTGIVSIAEGAEFEPGDVIELTSDNDWANKGIVSTVVAGGQGFQLEASLPTDQLPGGTAQAIRYNAAAAITGPEAFRLPGGYLSREFRIRIRTSNRIQQVIFASSMEQLRKSE